ncbi:hypothetical protein ACS0TY_003413 [Phlomoides rotata]
MLQPDLGPVGGCSKGGVLVSVSKRKRKTAVRALNHVQIETGSLKKKVPSFPLTFTEDDLNGIMTPHNNSLVVSANIMGTKVHRLLIDTGSYANIIFRSTLDKL